MFRLSRYEVKCFDVLQTKLHNIEIVLCDRHTIVTNGCSWDNRFVPHNLTWRKFSSVLVIDEVSCACAFLVVCLNAVNKVTPCLISSYHL